MGEGGQVLDIGGRISGMRGNCGRPPLPTKFIEQISFQEIEEREVNIFISSNMIVKSTRFCYAIDNFWYTNLFLFIHQFLGKGSFGVVIRGFWRGQDVAVKIFHKDSEQEAFKVRRIEICISNLINDVPFIILIFTFKTSQMISTLSTCIGWASSAI